MTTIQISQADRLLNRRLKQGYIYYCRSTLHKCGASSLLRANSDNFWTCAVLRCGCFWFGRRTRLCDCLPINCTCWNVCLLCPAPKQWSCLTSVCLSRTSGLSREQSKKTKIGTEVAHVTRDSDTTFKVKRSKVKVTGGGGILWRPSTQLVINSWAIPTRWS